MKHLRLATLILSLFSLSACQTLDGLASDLDGLNLNSMSLSESTPEQLVYDGKCPQIEVVEELSALNEFTNPAAPVERNLISRAEITDINSACTHEQSAVIMDLKMTFEGALGPHARRSVNDKPFFSYPFFVAVTDAGGDILAKEIFSANITYGAGENTHTYYEKMRQIIPVENRDRGGRYKILIGFQIDPDQLAYNRKMIKQEKAAAATRAAAQAAAAAPKPSVTRITEEPATSEEGAPTTLSPQY